MVKVKGFDRLQRELKRAQQALGELGGEIGGVSFNPEDPESIDQAISSMERIIDEKLVGFEDNAIASSLAAQMKEQYRSGILQRAAEARLKGSE
ncbi:hypothetical protein [Ketogulonicigenium vulgare]|uniref:hypothetical protein n=1 Tax=Ketogulonicigenium vulgare TaxID=92945 RepID=UPI00235A14F9|nr:hypothetical protein [Ketogulonicigenium vulgare]